MSWPFVSSESREAVVFSSDSWEAVVFCQQMTWYDAQEQVQEKMGVEVRDLSVDYQLAQVRLVELHSMVGVGLLAAVFSQFEEEVEEGRDQNREQQCYCASP